MASFFRLICTLVSLVATILFAGVSELLCTPLEPWFSSLYLPKMFVNDNFHNAMWLAIYLAISWAMSHAIATRDKISILLWGMFFASSIVAVAMIFTAKNLLFCLVALAISITLLLLISHREKHSSIAVAITVCWYVYLAGMVAIML